MTRIQEMSLNYHFIVEQEVGSCTYSFFGFNGRNLQRTFGSFSLNLISSTHLLYCVLYGNTGTAGVWRMSALSEAGGWKDRTTVEDMDLAVRASLKGWKFVYVGEVKVHLQKLANHYDISMALRKGIGYFISSKELCFYNANLANQVF